MIKNRRSCDDLEMKRVGFSQCVHQYDLQLCSICGHKNLTWPNSRRRETNYVSIDLTLTGMKKMKSRITTVGEWLKNLLIIRLINLTQQVGGLIRRGANCTFTATLNLAAAKKGIADEVWQAAVQVNRGQAALKALPGNHQFREVLVHVGSQTSNKQISWRNRRR